MSQLIKTFSSLFPYEPTHCQHKAIEELSVFLRSRLPHSLFLLTGYAGTGKTTFISVLVNFLRKHEVGFVLLAPTGRAAKVMASYTSAKAYTIHKRIYSLTITAEGFFKLSLQPNFYKNTFFIIDEASMINDSPSAKNSLLNDLVTYVKSGKNCRLILVGDKAQLPPVGADTSPALDIKNLESLYGFSVFHTHFQTVVRQQQESGILANATALRLALNNNVIAPPFFGLKNHTDIARVSGVDLRDVLDAAYADNALHDVMILCRSNKRANLYNQQIRNIILFRENIISAGDIMMVVKNNYFWLPPEHSAGFIANGDIIEILRINSFYSLYGFDFADVSIRLADYPDDINIETTLLLNSIAAEGPALGAADNQKLYEEVMKDYDDIETKKEKLEKLRLNPHLNALQVKFAYAITTHKAQGGQWPTVFIDHGFLHDEQIDISFIRWLYTALTRATEKVYLINFNDNFFI